MCIKVLLRAKEIAFAIVLLLLFLVVAQVPRTESSTGTSEENALSFLREVLGFDMSKYTATLTERTQDDNGKEHITYRLNSPLIGYFDASFMFFEGKLGSCILNPPFVGLLDSQSSPDQLNTTLRILENYQRWTDDPQIYEMINLLGKASSIRNTTEFSGNLTFKIVAYSPSHVVYKFTNTFNDVEYTGLSITFGSSIFFFDDSRAYRTIGDTTIYVSKEEAIDIAENYVKKYSSTLALMNGTILTVSNLNVSGVGPVTLTTHVSDPNDNQTEIENAPLLPYWYIQINVNSLHNLEGVAVSVSATDGSVASSTLIASPYFYFGEPDPRIPPFFPNLVYLFASILVIFAGVVVVIVGTMLFSNRRKGQSLSINAP